MTKEKSMTAEQYKNYRGLIKLSVREGVNGKTATLAFPDMTFSVSAPDDMPKRQQKAFVSAQVEKRAEQYYLKDGE